MTFCPRCGKPTEHQFCLDCLRELHPLVQNIAVVNAIMCPSCMRTYTTAWGNKPLQEIIEKQLKRRITFAEGATISNMVLEEVAIEPGKQILALTVVGSADERGEHYEEYYELTVLIEGRRCTQCEQQANAYFTGILQLRNPNDIVCEAIERLLGKTLTNVKDVTGGLDYYVADKRILANVSRQVQSEFGGELTIRAQHFSYDNLRSKNLYRVNACIRVPKYWVGSVIEAATKIVLVKQMGKRLHCIDIMTGKQVNVPSKNDYPIFDTEEASIVTVRPTLTVLDPETYQSVPIANAELFTNLTVDAKVRTIELDGKRYVVDL